MECAHSTDLCSLETISRGFEDERLDFIYFVVNKPICLKNLLGLKLALVRLPKLLYGNGDIPEHAKLFDTPVLSDFGNIIF